MEFAIDVLGIIAFILFLQLGGNSCVGTTTLTYSVDGTKHTLVIGEKK